MTQRPSARSRLFRPTLVMIYVGLGLMAIMLEIVGWAIYDSRQAARRQAIEQTSNLALGLERDVGRAIDTFDLSLGAAVQGMALPGIATIDPTLRQAILFDGAIEAKGFGPVFITDAKGTVLYESTGPNARVADISDQPFFRVHAAGLGQDLAISHPIRTRDNGEWVLALSRRISRPDGSFAGVVVGELKLSYFYALFNPLAVGSKGGVGLFSTDGWLIARWPYAEQDVGRDVSQGDVFARMSRSASGTVEATASIDHIQRLYSFRRVGSLPLLITVGVATEDVFAEWRQKSIVIGSAVFILCLLASGLGWAINQQFKRQHEADLARLNALFLNSPDAMFVASVTGDGHVSYEVVNPGWEQMSGLSAVQALGRDPSECWPPTVAQTVLGAWRRCLDGEAVRYGFTLDRAGAAQDWEVFVAPVRDRRGQVSRLIGVARDTTERTRLEAKLRQAQRMEAVGQLTAGIAHDFNNLLQAILGSIEVLRGQPSLDGEGEECIEVAEDAARRCASLVHRLLAFSRKQTLDPRAVDPAQAVEDTAALLARTLRGRIRVVLDVDPSCWPVFADGAQLDDCLCNLALNARDAMPEGGVLTLRANNLDVEAAEAAGLPPRDYVRFVVEDEGEGMSAELAARALEPFFTTKAIGKGTGLGLSMVQGFARQSGGDIRIDSVQGQGTKVTLWLPRATPEPSRLAPVRARPHVLLVTDEAVARDALSTFLVEAGLEPVAVESGPAALDYLYTGEPCDLLVTDQSLPGMSGWAFIEKTVRLRPMLPILLLTSHDMVRDTIQTLDQVAVLRKPFNPRAFVGQVQAMVGQSADLQA